MKQKYEMYTMFTEINYSFRLLKNYKYFTLVSFTEWILSIKLMMIRDHVTDG